MRGDFESHLRARKVRLGKKAAQLLPDMLNRAITRQQATATDQQSLARKQRLLAKAVYLEVQRESLVLKVFEGEHEAVVNGEVSMRLLSMVPTMFCSCKGCTETERRLHSFPDNPGRRKDTPVDGIHQNRSKACQILQHQKALHRIDREGDGTEPQWAGIRSPGLQAVQAF